jgi:TonB family protein
LRPVVRINPEYPLDALQAGREGVVELEFTIAANGSPKDVVVLDASSPEFEAPAVAAVLKWRYLPTNIECVESVGTPDRREPPVCSPIANQEPVERPGVRTTLRFELAR